MYTNIPSEVPINLHRPRDGWAPKNERIHIFLQRTQFPTPGRILIMNDWNGMELILFKSTKTSFTGITSLLGGLFYEVFVGKRAKLVPCEAFKINKSKFKTWVRTFYHCINEKRYKRVRKFEIQFSSKSYIDSLQFAFKQLDFNSKVMLSITYIASMCTSWLILTR